MLEETIRKHALKNAFQYGKADEKAIVGKVIAEFPDAKKDMQNTMSLVKKIVAEVNKLKKSQLEEELKNYRFEEKKEEGERKFRIEGAEEGKVVTRFLPEPNGYLHIGHAKAAFLSYGLSLQFKGKCLLRFDDTNPEAESQEFVDAIKRNLQWLGLHFASESYTSDKLPQLYKFAEKMMILNKAYACTCSSEEIKRNRFAAKECACRARKGGENLHLWEKMRKGEVEKGGMILRFKGSMGSENTVMRDPTLFRIIKTPHYRQGTKYFAWPTYDFEVSISDSLDGVTHALRSKEYELRDELYYAVLNAINLRKPVVYDFSRLNMKGTILSKRFLKPLIESKKVLGWNDPRLPTLDGLQRRGILPEAIKEFVLRQGLSKVESTPAFEDLLAINRQLLDPLAEHYFFVQDPVPLIIKDLPPELQSHSLELRKHPYKPGSRKFVTSTQFLIPGTDAKILKMRESFRLKELFNVKLVKKGKGALEAKFVGMEGGKDMKKLHWLPSDENQYVQCEVLEPLALLNDKNEFNEEGLSIKKGYAEKACIELAIGSIIQFERYGFCRLDENVAGKLIFIFSS